MYCWVVPNVAAEIWGISLDEVMNRIQNGVVVSKREYGFLLVDTAPLGPLFKSTAAEGKAKPRTWVPCRPGSRPMRMKNPSTTPESILPSMAIQSNKNRTLES